MQSPDHVAPQKKKKKRIGPIRIIALFFCIGVMLYSGINLGKYYYVSWKEKRLNSDLLADFVPQVTAPGPGPSATPSPDTSGDTDEPPNPNAYPPQNPETLAVLSKLAEENSDFKGILYIPGTKLQVMVAQADDNDYYLHRSLKRVESKSGTPFIDFRCATDPFGDNTIIYGHHMRDGSMFARLMDYKKTETVMDAPIVVFDTMEASFRYEIFAAYIDSSDGIAQDVLIPAFHDEAAFGEYIGHIREKTLIRPVVDVQYGDQLLTLSTCAYDFKDARMVVHARLLRPREY